MNLIKGVMRTQWQENRSLGGWMVCICLSLLLHGAWIGIRAEVNILEHVVGGQPLLVHVEDIDACHAATCNGGDGGHHHHAATDSHTDTSGTSGTDGQPLDIHGHHHFSDNAPSLVPELTTAEGSAFSVASRFQRARPDILDGVKPAGPFQPPRT